MSQDSSKANDFSPKKIGNGSSQEPKVYSFVKPDMEVHIDEQELERKEDVEVVCRCDKVCTCNTVSTGQMKCRCDTVAKCTCESVSVCGCDTVMVCQCDAVTIAKPSCSCDSYSPGGGGTRVCRCVPVPAH
jgi:hypothetical protein